MATSKDSSLDGMSRADCQRDMAFADELRELSDLETRVFQTYCCSWLESILNMPPRLRLSSELIIQIASILPRSHKNLALDLSFRIQSIRTQPKRGFCSFGPRVSISQTLLDRMCVSYFKTSFINEVFRCE